MSWDQWECRNGALRNKPMVTDLSGALSLAEYKLDPVRLPVKVHRVFPSDIQILLTESLIERKCWLVLFRTACEITQESDSK